MNSKNKIKKLLAKRVAVLDGAMGTQLQKYSMPSGACPELWCLKNPGVLQSIHQQYVKAGSDVIYTCTFGANRYKLSQYGVSDVAGTNRKLARLAKGAGALVAGDIGPTGKFVKPFGELEFEDAVNAFKEQVKGLLAGGVDLLVIETMMDIQEARAALLAVKETCDLFTIVTMTFEKDGRTLHGSDPLSALVTLQSLGADAVGCNCSTGPKDMLEVIKKIKPYATVPLAAKPNAGVPKLVKDQTVFEMGPDEFGACAADFLKAGVNLMGGCCGTSPEHIRKLAKKLAGKKPKPATRRSLSAVSSCRKTVVFDAGQPLCLVGERINPTGKKALQEELSKGQTNLVRAFAQEQQVSGAQMLDVNVGAAGIDEEKVLPQVAGFLALHNELPLVLDSSNLKALEKTLRIYPGRAFVNSISAEKAKLQKFLPVVAKYGAMFVLLPLTDKGIPQDLGQRKAAVLKVLKEAKKSGLTPDDVAVDGLVMTAASHPQSAAVTLQTIDWANRVLGCATTIGVSNISFGLPSRVWVNAAFLAMAQNAGLRMVIANPQSQELINILKAADLLGAKDKEGRNYISHFNRAIEREPVRLDLPLDKKVYNAIIEGDRESIEALIGQALSAGIDPAKLVNEFMIPAITKVGELYDKREYFLPQLIASAEAMQKGFNLIRPKLTLAQEPQANALVLIATVQGDIHDIGKNIVGLLLSNHGFEVADLGKDVSSRRIIEEIKRRKPALVGLSALMTTTMVKMEEVMRLAKKEGLACKFMVGGAVVNANYARAIGAEYAQDGVEAVRLAKRLTSL